MVLPTSAGTRRRLASEPTTIAVNVSGTVHAAGTLTRIAAQPDSGGPTMVTSTAVTAAPPPATSPATAPGAVSPRHQSPRTSSGQKLDAATANASPTTWDTSRSPARKASS